MSDISRSFITKARATYNGANGEQSTGGAAPALSLDGNKLFIDGAVEGNAEFSSDAMTVIWKNDSPGNFRSGRIEFDKKTEILTGYSMRGAAPASAYCTDFVGYLAPSVYQTRITENGTQRSGPEVAIGYTIPDGNGFPERLLKIGGLKIDQYVLEVSPNNRTIYNMRANTESVVRASMGPYQFPMSCKFEMTFDARHFKGTYDKFTKFENEIPKSTPLTWEGDYNAYYAAPAALVSPITPATPFSDAGVADDALGILELFAMHAASAEIQMKAQELLIRNMQYTISDKQRQELLGVSKPSIADSCPGLKSLNLESAKQFYGNDFFDGYLGNAFYARPPSERITISDGDAWKLGYYMQRGICGLLPFSEHTQSLYLECFLEQEPRLQEFLNDQTKREDPEYWAKKLYAVIISDTELNRGVYNYVNGIGNPFDIYRVRGNVMNFLQPSGELANKSIAVLNGAILTTASHDVIFETDLTMEWLPENIMALIGAFSEQANASKALSEVAREAKLLSEMFSSPSALAQAIIDVVRDTQVWEKYALPNKVAQWADAFSSKYPKKAEGLTKLKPFLFCVFYAGSLGSFLMGLYNWNKITDYQKIQVVRDTIDMSGKVIVEIGGLGDWDADKVVEFNKFFANVTAKGCTNLLQVYFKLFNSDEKNLFSELTTNISRYFDKSSKSIVVPETDSLSKMLKNPTNSIKMLAPVVSLAGACFAASRVYYAAKNGGSELERAMDDLVNVSDKMKTIFHITENSVDIEWSGPASLISVVVGAISALVFKSLPKESQTAPAEDYIIGGLSQFLQYKPVPPHDWRVNHPLVKL